MRPGESPLSSGWRENKKADEAYLPYQHDRALRGDNSVRFYRLVLVSDVMYYCLVNVLPVPPGPPLPPATPHFLIRVYSKLFARVLDSRFWVKIMIMSTPSVNVSSSHSPQLLLWMRAPHMSLCFHLRPDDFWTASKKGPHVCGTMNLISKHIAVNIPITVLPLQ